MTTSHTHVAGASSGTLPSWAATCTLAANMVATPARTHKETTCRASFASATTKSANASAADLGAPPRVYSSEKHVAGFGWEEGSCYTALTVMLLFVASWAPRAPRRVSAAWRMLAAATLQVQRLQARDLCTVVQPQQTAL